MKLNRKTTIICLAIYATVTLAGRFYFEAKFNMDVATSLALGIAFIGIPGLLFRVGLLNLND